MSEVLNTRRHIVFIAHFAGSPVHGMVTGYYYLAQQWLAEGCDVTIISAGFVHTRYRNPSLTNRVTEEFIDGIRYIWLKTPTYNSKGRLGRVVNILSFSFQALFLSLPLKAVSSVICSSHHPLAIFAAERIANRYRATLLYEVRDLWPLTLIELGGASPKNLLIMLMQYAEDRAYRKAQSVVSVLSHSKSYMVSRGLLPNKFHYIPNGVVPIE